MKHQIEWFDMETGESVGIFPYDPTDDLEAFICPKCGKRTEYWEGQIDQDRMGNDIYGYSYDCCNCKIHTACEAL
jgi:DNA-directed RNA polymerase subunit M/transcription elongation factor TFIIS